MKPALKTRRPTPVYDGTILIRDLSVATPAHQRADYWIVSREGKIFAQGLRLR